MRLYETSQSFICIVPIEIVNFIPDFTQITFGEPENCVIYARNTPQCRDEFIGLK